MKFGIVCDVEGKTYLGNGITIEGDGMIYIFYVKNIDDRLLNQIRIISEVDNPERYYYFKSPVNEEGQFTVNRGFEEHILDKLIQEMQRIESCLALVANIKRVYWNKAILEYYPETTEEHARFNILPTWFFMHEMTTDDPRGVDTNTLIHLVEQRALFQPFVVPMAFYREAKTEYSAARYINAFFNSYFIIEGLFGNGKFKTNGVIEELTKSSVFTGFVQKFLDEVAKNNNPNEGMTKSQLEAELKSKNQDYTIEGLIKYIVDTRGSLHHFSMKSPKAQGTPLNNADYKRLSLIAFVLAGNSLMYYLDQQTKDKTQIS
ncbi:MAG TPA: hypothetical protein VF553_02385 [Pyrinomonadaceae bacterium]|jgi:hypothetical protein